MDASTLIFAAPQWFWAPPALIAAAIPIWCFYHLKVRARLGCFVSPRTLQEALSCVSWPRKTLRYALLICSLCLLSLALARPLTGPRQGKSASGGVDFVIALDLSKSMLVEDVPPNRLAAAKKELDEWIGSLRGDRIGLVLFAGEAFVQAPMTVDHRALRKVLAAAKPGSLAIGGTNITEAIEIAQPMLTRDERSSRALIVITDGENLIGDPLLAAQKAHSEYNIAVHTIGVGTLGGGKVPTQDYSARKEPPKQKQYVRNEYGADAVSRMDERALRAIAAAGGGRSMLFEPGQRTFESFYSENLLPLARTGKEIDTSDYDEWFQFPLGAAILVLVLSLTISPARKKTAKPHVGVPVLQPASVLAAATILIVLSGTCKTARADPLKEAERLLAAGQPAKAVDQVRMLSEQHPNDYYALYNYALTLYRAGRFQDAVVVFDRVALEITDPELRIRAAFQSANAQLRLGEKLRNGSGALLALERAAAQYDSLSRASDKIGRDAKTNYALAVKLLEDTLLKTAQGRMEAAAALIKKNALEPAETVLRETQQAFERASQVNPKNFETTKRIEAAKETLLQNLVAQARKNAREADALDSAEHTKAGDIFEKRQLAISKYDYALQMAPADAPALATERHNQILIMSGQLTEEAALLLDENQLAIRSRAEKQKAAEQAREKLQTALALHADNSRARSLLNSATERLIGIYLQATERDMATARGSKADPATRLSAVTRAIELFQKALALDAQSGDALAALREAESLIPALHAQVGAGQYLNAEAHLEDFRIYHEKRERKRRYYPKGPEEEAYRREKTNKAIGSLQRSVENYGIAVGGDPENAEYKQSLAKAEKLLNSLMEQLDPFAQEASIPETFFEQPEFSPGSLEGAVSGYSFKSHARKKRRDSEKGKGDNKNFWERFGRDW